MSNEAAVVSAPPATGKAAFVLLASAPAAPAAPASAAAAAPTAPAPAAAAPSLSPLFTLYR